MCQPVGLHLLNAPGQHLGAGCACSLWRWRWGAATPGWPFYVNRGAGCPRVLAALGVGNAGQARASEEPWPEVAALRGAEAE